MTGLVVGIGWGSRRMRGGCSSGNGRATDGQSEDCCGDGSGCGGDRCDCDATVSDDGKSCRRSGCDARRDRLFLDKESPTIVLLFSRSTVNRCPKHFPFFLLTKGFVYFTFSSASDREEEWQENK